MSIRFEGRQHASAKRKCDPESLEACPVKRERLSLTQKSEPTLSLLCLPVDCQISVVRKLSLIDQLSYSEVCTVTHDFVMYVWSHQYCLDFSTLLNPNGWIPLTDDKLLSLMHAHTRASVIRNLCFSPYFTAYSELTTFLSLYWHHSKRSAVSDSDTDCSLSVGHPSGNLFTIRYSPHSYYGGSNLKQGLILLEIWDKFNDKYSVQINKETPYPFAKDYTDHENWSSIDVDCPYFTCYSCFQPLWIEQLSTLCDSCYGQLKFPTGSLDPAPALTKELMQFSSKLCCLNCQKEFGTEVKFFKICEQCMLLTCGKSITVPYLFDDSD